ncbi:hypothetical protein H6F41_15530 [Pseudanabaena sp. FACHB-723]|uniref:Uncharacterized protein n=1 Tax=Pseudanabaena mucicola FACHB-723 TaxID=2692860 RepID=A0ABR8A182_9CYAN|nr:hypothetical protein [Pseudanabaena mucicola FACHB-723]
MAGFALDVGDLLLINGEEVIFKGWVDQSQTAIEVKAIADDNASVKQIRAREITSLSRSLGNGEIPREEANSTAEVSAQQSSPPSDETTATATVDQDHSDHHDQEIPQPSTESVEETPIPETEPAKEPEYNAWEVWTYLERQRVKTLKLLNTFQAEWEANRFVREAERSAPPNLRVHYEVRPIWLDEAEMHGNDQNSEQSSRSNNKQEDLDQADYSEYADAIDVEVVAESL